MALLAALLAAGSACGEGAPTERGCAQHGEWLVTGYYLPLEADFGPADVTALVDGHPHKLNTDFMKAVRLQGWGRDRAGEYIGVAKVSKSGAGPGTGPGPDGKVWSFKTDGAPLTGSGKPLAAGDASADPAVLPTGRMLRIRGTQGYPNHHYRVSDTGGKIKGRHIDIYVGEGAAAGKESMAVTGCREIEDGGGHLLAAR
jgi:3D (Asp-Asp-Asp) domain-containing protein